MRIFANYETIDIQGAVIREEQGSPDPFLKSDIRFVFDTQAPFRDIQDLQLLLLIDKSGAPIQPVADTGKFPAFRKGVRRNFVLGIVVFSGNVFNDDGYKEKNNRYPGL